MNSSNRSPTRRESSLRSAKTLRCSPEGGKDRLGELVLAHRRRAHRLPAEGRSNGGRNAPRPRRVVGRNDGREADAEASGVLEDQPAECAGKRGAQPNERRVGTWSGGRREVDER